MKLSNKEVSNCKGGKNRIHLQDNSVIGITDTIDLQEEDVTKPTPRALSRVGWRNVKVIRS